MFKTLILVIFIMFFQACATWSGIKQDSSEAWEATKSTSNKAYKSVKKSIHEATAE